jgi:hypothetical protein
MLMKFLLACLIALQSACVGGFGVFSTTTENYRPEKGVEEIPVRPGTSTRAEVLGVLGKPKREYTEGSRDVWVYNHSVAWRGMVPVLIVPIPLMIPVGMNESFVAFENDRVFSFRNERGNVRGGMCLFLLKGCVPMATGADVMNPSPPRDVER